VADRSYYEVLGVAQTASQEEIRAAHRRLVKFAHPDAGGSAALFDLVREAYGVLGDPAQRAQYDRGRTSAHEPPTTGDASSAERCNDTPRSRHTNTPPPRQPGFTTRSDAPKGRPKRYGPFASLLLVMVLSAGLKLYGAAADRDHAFLLRFGAALLGCLLLWTFVGAGAGRIADRLLSLAALAALLGGAGTLAWPALASDDAPSSAPNVSIDTTGEAPSPAPSMPPVTAAATSAVPGPASGTTPPTTTSPIKTAPPPPPPDPCAYKSKVHASYILASEQEPDGIGTDYWPRVSIRNDSSRPVVVAFQGEGEASNPDFPKYPLQMGWGVDDLPITVRPHSIKTRDLGHDTGEVLAVFRGGTITKMHLTARAGHSDDFVYGAGASCALHVSR
jgi:hypothetical protein